MSLIEYEGRQIELPNEITSDDEKLLEVLLPYFPELSQATIERKAGKPIKIIKQAKTKGVEESQKELSILHKTSVFQCQIKTPQILPPTPHSPLPTLLTYDSTRRSKSSCPTHLGSPM